VSSVLEGITDLDSLARLVLEVDENVKDYLDVTAILEAMGITTATARKYGFPNKFELARKVVEVIQYYRTRGEVVGGPKISEQRLMLEALKRFLFGSLLASPWLFLTISYLLIGVTLLPAGEITTATMVSMASALSLLATSGLQAVFTRRLSFYYHQQNYGAARRILALYYTLSACVISVMAFLMLVVNRILNLYPEAWMELAVIYFIPLSLLWVSVAPLYVLNAYAPLAMIFFFALLAISLSLRLSMGISPIYAHLYGIYLGVVMAIVYFLVYLYVRERMLKKTGLLMWSLEPRIPKLFYILYSGAPYFLSSTLYFLFLTMDRFIAWTASKEPILLVNTRYEFSVNTALLILCPVFGVLNYYMNRFYKMVVEGGRLFKARDVHSYRKELMKMYWRTLRAAIPVGIIGLLVIYFLINYYLPTLPMEISPLTLLYSGIGNVFLTVFLVNSLVCFYFYRPWPAIASLAIGLLVDILVGFPASRLIGVDYASLGYLAGSVALAAASSLLAYKFVEEADYSYYSAF